MTKADTSFEHIWLDRVTVEDIKCLQKIADICYYGYTVEDMLGYIRDFTLAAFRGDGYLVLVEVQDHPAGKELYLWGVGGKNYMANVELVIRELKIYGKANGCRTLATNAVHDGFDKVLDKAGAKLIHKHYAMEL